MNPHIVRVVLPALEAASFKAREYPLKSSWFPAIFVVSLIILSTACGAGQPTDQTPQSVPTTESPARSANETLQPTVHVKPTVTPEHQKVPKSQPTMNPTPMDPLKPTNTPERQGKAQPIPTDVPEPTPNAYLPKTVVVKKTPIPQRGRPVLAEGEVAKEILIWVKNASEPFGTNIEIEDSKGYIRL